MWLLSNVALKSAGLFGRWWSVQLDYTRSVKLCNVSRDITDKTPTSPTKIFPSNHPIDIFWRNVTNIYSFRACRKVERRDVNFAFLESYYLLENCNYQKIAAVFRPQKRIDNAAWCNKIGCKLHMRLRGGLLGGFKNKIIKSGLGG